MAKKSTKSNIPTAGFMDKNWQADDDLRTMMRSCEIRKDKKRMAAVKALAKQKRAELDKISAETAGKG